MKIVVSDPKEGRTYQKEIDEDEEKALYRKRIGQEIQGSLLDLNGYTLKITGGSDKQGFPMRKGVNTTERRKVLLSSGTGFNPKKKGIKRRKTVRGEIVNKEIEQLNLKVTKEGKKDLKVLFGLEEEPEETKEEEKEETETEEAESEEKEETETEEETEEQEKDEEAEEETEEQEEKEPEEENEKETEEVECPECGETFDSEKGMKIHKSQAH